MSDARLARQLKAAFPWLGTEECASGADTVDQLCDLYRRATETDEGTPDADLTEPRDADYIAVAKDLWEKEGEIEIDDEAVVSSGDDDGAYVMAWVWVNRSENFCDTCHKPYDGSGDGFDGDCPECADKAEERRLCECGRKESECAATLDPDAPHADVDSAASRKPYCVMCGAVDGEPHHDVDAEGAIVTLHEHNGKRLCMLCRQGMLEIENPFITGPDTQSIDADSRCRMVKSFDAEQCAAALKVPGLQATVRKAIERRLRHIGKTRVSSVPAARKDPTLMTSDQLDELKKELDMFYGRGKYKSPSNTCYLDGYFAKSLEEKYGLPLERLDVLARKAESRSGRGGKRK